ncbi:hypothetical protein D932_02106 [Enterococcus casseliflavus 14-MB-W-14]|nr:hypothetical protein D932_02106 [Enterococcus casseliflavus 14-MB-W-14]
MDLMLATLSPALSPSPKRWTHVHKPWPYRSVMMIVFSSGINTTSSWLRSIGSRFL